MNTLFHIWYYQNSGLRAYLGSWFVLICDLNHADKVIGSNILKHELLPVCQDLHHPRLEIEVKSRMMCFRFWQCNLYLYQNWINTWLFILWNIIFGSIFNLCLCKLNIAGESLVVWSVAFLWSHTVVKSFVQYTALLSHDTVTTGQQSRQAYMLGQLSSLWRLRTTVFTFILDILVNRMSAWQLILQRSDDSYPNIIHVRTHNLCQVYFESFPSHFFQGISKSSCRIGAVEHHNEVLKILLLVV